MPETHDYRVLDREFLEARSRILQMAAILDRLERSATADSADPRWQKLLAGLACLSAERPEAGTRAEQVQLVFSRGYDAAWREQFGV